MKFITAALFCIIAINVMGQTAQQTKTDQVFQKVAKAIDTREADSVYALASDRFKRYFKADTFAQILNNQLYPLGHIKQTSLISFQNNQVATYRVIFAKATLQLVILLDEQDKFDLLRFQPDKPQIGNKIENVATSNPLATAFDKKIDTAVRPYIQKGNTVGMSIGVWHDGQSAFYNYGETETGNGILPTADNIYEIGSITKTFTATLLAWYVEQKKVKLTDPITKYLPDSVSSNYTLQHVTLEMLSNHTSGLPSLPRGFEKHISDQLNPYSTYSKAQLFTDLANSSLSSKPGEQYAYSNWGAGLLGVILERISGKSFDAMVSEVVTQPLGMNSTEEALNADQQKRFMAPHNDEGNPTKPWTFEALSAAGAFRSSANDLLKYALANMNPGDNKLGKAMALTHQFTYNKDIKLGLAWHVITLRGTDYLFHNGATEGSSAFLAFNAEKNIAIVILSNSGEVVDGVGQAILAGLQ